jgi:(4S)-4-hydroxy-5-phosphonooxypentane-2,3-dione isomerase
MSYAVVVEFLLRSGQKEAFVPLILENAAQSVELEPGCYQFDVCASEDKPDHILLYEIYENAAAFDAHLAMPHFHEFNTQTSSMVVEKTVRTFARLS